MRQFTQLLGKYIDSSGMKQTRIAATAGISYNYLQRLLSGNRNPGEQVVYKLAEALHLSPEQTSGLVAAAGFAPSLALLNASPSGQQMNTALPVPTTETDQITRLAQQLYRLAQEVPDGLQTAFLDEMRHLLGYARYKYILSGGVGLLNLNTRTTTLISESKGADQQEQTYLDLIAQLVGELHKDQEEDRPDTEEDQPQLSQAVEDMLSAIDRLTGNILAGELSLENYQPHLIVQMLEMLREGAPWEIRRRIAEALPGLCQLDVQGAEHLMEMLRSDFDEVRGADIRRRVIEALPVLFETSCQSLLTIVRLLRSRSGDDIYVALATVETCGDIQQKCKQLLNSEVLPPAIDLPEGATLLSLLQHNQTEIAKIQRQLLSDWEGMEREILQFSVVLHDLLCAPDTLLISLREGLQSPETLMQWVATRYLERVLPARPSEALELYKMLLRPPARRKNIRRTVAKALPSLLRCMKETSLSTRALARDVISNLANDSDLYIRRAVADHAMQIFYIDREFLLILLRQMHKDTDQAIRHRLRPVALRLAQVWLTWYAETVGLVETKRSHNKSTTPFGE